MVWQLDLFGGLPNSLGLMVINESLSLSYGPDLGDTRSGGRMGRFKKSKKIKKKKQKKNIKKNKKNKKNKKTYAPLLQLSVGYHFVVCV